MTSKAHQCDTNLSSRGDDVQLVCFDVILMRSVTWMTNQLDVDLTRKAIGRREGEGRGRTPRVSTPL